MYISIEGNIGAGKTTLAKALAEKLDAYFLPERFEDNTLLPLFYKEPEIYAFPTEYSFLIDRQKQLSTFFASQQLNKHIVSDFHFDKCICFAEANLSENDFSFFAKHYDAIKKTVQQPDIVVYLNVEIDTLTQNIQKRGREIEKELNANYLRKLKKSLDNYYLSDDKENHIVLNMETYNLDTLNQNIETILERIKHKNYPL